MPNISKNKTPYRTGQVTDKEVTSAYYKSLTAHVRGAKLPDWNDLYLIQVELSATYEANPNLRRRMREGIMNLTRTEY